MSSSGGGATPIGVEYRLRFNTAAPEAVAAVIERLPCASKSTPSGVFNLRSTASGDAMPDAEVRVEPGGAYYCCYGGSSRELLGVLVASLVDRFGAVTIEDFE